MIKVNPYPYLAALIVLVALYAGHRAIVAYEVKQAVTISKTAMQKDYQDKLLLASSQARKKELALEKTASDNLKVKDDKIKSITVQRDAALIRLRNRPTRPSPNSPQDSPNSPACTGAKLYQEDGGFLIREATRCERVMQERDYYYRQYEDMRKQINEYSNSH